MKKSFLFVSAILAVAFLFIFVLNTDKASGIELTMYKSSSCGCCSGHASYLDGKGYDVNKIELQDVSGIKAKYNIPQNMRSCHTSIIEGYFVEGHMPVKAINKLLEESPDIKGISLPGMPSGTPGMPGSKTSEWIIYSLDNNGNWNEFMRV